MIKIKKLLCYKPLSLFKRKPNIKITATVELKDANGKITKVITKECHSYVLQFVDLLYGLLVAPITSISTSSISLKDTSNTSRNVGVSCIAGSPLASNVVVLLGSAGVGDNSYGIVVGNTANVAIADVNLNSIINNGITNGLLLYSNTSVNPSSTVGTSRKFVISRTFTNYSGADITVNEVGFMLKAYAGTTPYSFLLEHSNLTFTITNGTSGTVTYTISVVI